MKTIPVLAVSLSLAGCVSSAKHRALDDQRRSESERAATLEREIAATRSSLGSTIAEQSAASRSLQTQLAEAGAQVKSGAEQIASLKTQIGRLEESIKVSRAALEANKDELTAKVSELIKEKDGLSSRLAKTEANLAGLKAAKESEGAELRRQLDVVLAEKRAVEKAKEEELLRARQNHEQLTASLKSEIETGEIKITELKGKLTLNLVDRILFDSGEATVKPDGRKVLGRIAGVLNGVQGKDIRIEGHTDNVPIGGDLKDRYASNWELSTARATAVARYLQDHAKLDPRRLVATGLGEFRPVAPNDKAESRALNRRIEIVLVPRE